MALRDSKPRAIQSVVEEIRGRSVRLAAEAAEFWDKAQELKQKYSMGSILAALGDDADEFKVIYNAAKKLVPSLRPDLNADQADDLV